MHSTVFRAIAIEADDFSMEVVAIVEDVRARTPISVQAGAILANPDTNVFAFAVMTATEVDGDVRVEFDRIQDVGTNVSKAYKYLSDYTLDRRPLRPLEDGSMVESPREAIAA